MTPQDMNIPTLLTILHYIHYIHTVWVSIENNLSKKIDLCSHGPFLYICQSHDCHILSLVTVLGNMYNLCILH